MYCRSLLSLTVSLESLLSSTKKTINVTREIGTCTWMRCVSRSARTARAPRRRAGPGGTIPRARVTVRPRGVSVSAHILSKDTNTSQSAHTRRGANCKRWPAHMDMHKHTAPLHAAVSTCPICNAEQTDRRFGLTCSSLFCNSACAPSAAYSHLGALRRHERWSRAILKHLSGVSLRRVQDDSLLR